MTKEQIITACKLACRIRAQWEIMNEVHDIILFTGSIVSVGCFKKEDFDETIKQYNHL